MNISDYKKRLIELGMDERLVEMPAVTSDLLDLAVSKQLTFEEFDKLVLVVSSSEVKVQDRNVVLNGDGTASIEEYYKGKLISKAITDTNGMEVECEKYWGYKLLETYERRRGFIVKISEINSTGDNIKQSFFDIGHCFLANSCVVSPEDEFGRQKSFDSNYVLGRIDRIRKYMGENYLQYQHLEPFYEELRRQVENRIAAERSPERKIAAEANEEENLLAECRRLAKELELETRYLNINLEFLEGVKKHPLGKVTFERHLNKYSEEIGKLVAKDRGAEGNANKDGEEREKKEDEVPESELEKLRERRKKLAEKLKNARARKELATKCIEDILQEPTIKVASIFPIYARYDRKIKEYWGDILGVKTQEEIK